ncbi:MAG: glutamate--cysteine ligase [Gammaproteobacteria bacterium]
MPYLIQKLRNLQQDVPLFSGIRRGIEREGLRVTAAGLPATTPHPKALGSKLTHPYITTDYSENLLELITPPCTKVDALLDGMKNTHQFVAEQLQDEWIWPQSLPCPLVGEIPIANYGTTPAARLKMRYREGLGLRYGREMQTIAGLHYNFSFPKSFWETWYTHMDPAHDTLQSCIDTQYFRMIRQHMRHVWILAYLFGASMAIDKSLLQDKTAPYLVPFGKTGMIAPYGCSLRLTPLGYYSAVQNELLHVRCDSLAEYMADLKAGMQLPYPPYQQLAEIYGDQAQLNTNLLQIEAEFYHPIRPKRTPMPGESALDSLAAHGVEYLEVRAIDINPLEPTGFSRQQLLFLDVYLLFCLSKPSPLFTDHKDWLNTLHKVASIGRTPGLAIMFEGQQQPLKTALLTCFDQFVEIARLLDAEQSDGRYQAAVAHFHEAVLDPSKLLSAQYHQHLEKVGDMAEAGMVLARQHKEALLSTPLPPGKTLHFQEVAKNSLEEQHKLEQDSSVQP